MQISVKTESSYLDTKKCAVKLQGNIHAGE